MPDPADELRAAVKAAGKRRQAAQRAEKAATEDLAKLLQQADGVVPIVELAKLSGMSRGNIYRLIGPARVADVEQLRTELEAAQAELAALKSREAVNVDDGAAD